MGAASTGVTARIAAVAFTLAFTLAFGAPLAAQPTGLAALLLSTAWCHESSTGLSLHTTRVRFQADGTVVIRQDTEMMNGSHTGSTITARWGLANDVLLLQESDGSVTRLPLSVTGSGRDTRVTAGERTYAPCR